MRPLDALTARIRADVLREVAHMWLRHRRRMLLADDDGPAYPDEDPPPLNLDGRPVTDVPLP